MSYGVVCLTCRCYITAPDSPRQDHHCKCTTRQRPSVDGRVDAAPSQVAAAHEFTRQMERL